MNNAFYSYHGLTVRIVSKHDDTTTVGLIVYAPSGTWPARTLINEWLTFTPGGTGMTMSYVTPARGEDAELDRLVDEAIRVMSSGSLKYDEPTVRETMAKRLAEARGEKITETPATKKSAKPVVDIKAEEKELTTEAVAKVAESDDEPFFYENPDDFRFVKHFVEMRRKARIIGNLLVTGPSGSGKTEGLRRVGEQLGLPVYKLDCATITTEDKWIGHKEIDHEGTKFILSEHLKWLEAIEYAPGMLIYDEVNRIHPSRLNILIPILDGSQALFVPDAARYVPVHPETVIVATANIGSAFGGTFQMDRALRERFSFTLERTFPPEAAEIRVLTSATGVAKDKATKMIEIANATRRKWETGDLESPISTRTLKSAAYLVASGMSILKAFEYTALPLYKSEGGAASERGLVKGILEGKAVS
jgi:MoxR-like ATPase